MLNRLVPLVCAALAITTGPALGQAVGRGQGVESRLRQQPLPTADGREDDLSLNLELFGAFDDNFTADLGNQDTSIPNDVFVASSRAEVRFRRGRQRRSFATTGRAFVNHTTGGIGTFVGGSVDALATMPLSRRGGISIGGSALNEPNFLIGSFSPLADQMDGAPVTDATPATGITQQRWLTVSGLASVFRNISTRQRVDVEYAIARREPIERVGLTSKLQVASVRHSWNHWERGGTVLSYRLNDIRQRDDTGTDIPLQSHAGELAFRFELPLSSQRTFSTTAGGGVTFVRTFANESAVEDGFVLPTAFGQMRVALSRVWSISADARRDATVLQGVSPEPFSAVSTAARTDGIIGERYQVGLSVGYARGSGIERDVALFRTLGGSVQAQYLISRCCSVFSTYRYYKHEIGGLSALSSTLPPKFSRNSVQVGMTIWTPLQRRQF